MEGVRQLHATVGNQAVRRLFEIAPPKPHVAGDEAPTIRRMPTRKKIEKSLGKPSRLPTEGRKYKSLLSAIDDYHDYLSTKLSMNTFRAQFATLMKHLGDIRTRAQAYDGFSGKKATFVLGPLMREINTDQALIDSTLVRLLTDPPNYAIIPTLSQLLLIHVGRQTSAVQLDERRKVGNQRGGTSEVTEYSQPGGNAFFKPGKSTLETRSDDQLITAMKQQGVPDNELMDRLNPLQTERELAVKELGIDATDARMGNRDVAMYRLNQLLGEDLIARAQKAVKSDGTTGSLMDKATGTAANQLMKQQRFAKNANDMQRVGVTAIDQQDPNLMRLLSKLQIIDLLADQVDRNPKNYFIQQHPRTGEVTGITGIDNDLALGTRTDMSRLQELPGFSRYVDKALAQKILMLDLSLLPAVFGDLLSPAEIDAMTTRFQSLRAELSASTTQLLEPHEWDDAVAKGLLQENKSYWADIDYQKGKYGT